MKDLLEAIRENPKEVLSSIVMLIVMTAMLYVSIAIFGEV